MSDPLRAADALPPNATGFSSGGVSVRRGTSEMRLEGALASWRIFDLAERRWPVRQGIGGTPPADFPSFRGSPTPTRDPEALASLEEPKDAGSVDPSDSE